MKLASFTAASQTVRITQKMSKVAILANANGALADAEIKLVFQDTKGTHTLIPSVPLDVVSQYSTLGEGLRLLDGAGTSTFSARGEDMEFVEGAVIEITPGADFAIASGEEFVLTVSGLDGAATYQINTISMYEESRALTKFNALSCGETHKEYPVTAFDDIIIPADADFETLSIQFPNKAIDYTPHEVFMNYLLRDELYASDADNALTGAAAAPNHILEIVNATRISIRDAVPTFTMYGVQTLVK